MELTLVRHGQSAGNAGETLELDSALTERGREQAVATAERLRSETTTLGPLTRAFISPFRRTLMTFEPIHWATGVSAEILAQVCEYFAAHDERYETFDGLTADSIRAEFPFVAVPRDFAATETWWPEPLEDDAAIIARANAARDTLIARYGKTNYRILIVSHAETIGRIVEAFLRMEPNPDDPPWTSNCGIWRLTVDTKTFDAVATLENDMRISRARDIILPLIDIDEADEADEWDETDETDDEDEIDDTDEPLALEPAEWPARIDVALARLGIVRSRTEAQREILAGHVLINSKAATQTRTMVKESDVVELVGTSCPYVSRGGLKLAAALDEFKIDPTGLRCLDVGSSTGGFTDCLLQRGALSVIGIDSGHGQMDPTIEDDPRVDNREGVNARTIEPDDFDELFDLIVVNVSFISLTLIIANLVPLLEDGGKMVILIKPQFEVGRGNLGKGGIVHTERARQKAIKQVTDCTVEHGLTIQGAIESPIQGGDGNREYLIHANKTPAA